MTTTCRASMQIALYHKHYTESHLEAVKAEMVELGTPTIRAIWSEMYGLWLAVEGCHRLRAAEALNLYPEIDDISDEDTVTIQNDDEDEIVSVASLLEELQDSAWQAAIIEFAD